MLQHDERLSFINSGLTLPEDPGTAGISPQRIAEYRRYMSAIGCGAILYDRSIGSTVFVSDWQRRTDILFFPVAKRPAQAHHIEGSWYLASEDF
jgi:hypothetical protein